MFRLLAVLLTEIKFFGLPLRTPVLAFTPNTQRALIGSLLLSTLGLAYLYNFYILNAAFEKSNALLFVVISCGVIYLGCFLRFSISRSRLSATVFGVFVLFTVVSLSQAFSLFPSLNLVIQKIFQMDGYDFGGRASGFSAEPSYYAWVCAYFILLAQMCGPRIRVLSWIFWLVAFATSRSVSFIFVPLIYFFVFLLLNVRLGRLELTPVTTLFTLVGMLFLFDRLLYLTSGFGLGWFTYISAGSWRELSTLSAFYGGSAFQVPSAGTDWADILREGQLLQLPVGQDTRDWLQYPWSTAAMWVVELGVLLSAALILVIAKTQRSFLSGHHVPVHWLAVSVCSWFFGFFLAPKWCVFFFLIPRVTPSTLLPR